MRTQGAHVKKFELYEIVDGLEMYRGFRTTLEAASFVKAQKEAEDRRVKIVEYDEPFYQKCC